MTDRLSRAGLRAALVAAAAGAVVILAGVFGDEAGYAALGVIVVATVLSGGERREPDGRWWPVLAAGAALSLAGAALAELSETLGGLVAVAGGALVVIGAIVGYPVGEEGR